MLVWGATLALQPSLLQLQYMTHQNVHFVKHIIGRNQVVGYTNAMRLHKMAQAIGVRSDIR